MLKKLRWRFILAAMGAFFAVIVLIAFLVNFFTYAVITNRVDQSIEMIVSSDFRSPRDMMPEPRGGGNPFEGRPDMETSYMMRFFIVRVEESGDATYISTDFVASIDADTAVEYANKALSKRSDEGYIGNYRYAKIDNSGETVLIFLNASRELQFARTLCLLTIEISLASLILVFILVVIFSKKAIRPIENNIKQQKQFITDASHELKTPLAVIRANTEMSQMINGEDEWSVSTMKQIDHMSGLIANLVMISKAQELEDTTEMAEIDASEVVNNTVKTFEPVAMQSDITLENKVSEGVTITADASKIMQLTTILLDNSIKYCDGKGTVRVELVPQRRGLRLTVSNSYKDGANVDCNKFFERFYREDKSHNIDKGGYGIGLSIAENICRQYNGDIRAAWKNGEISFVCTLH